MNYFCNVLTNWNTRIDIIKITNNEIVKASYTNIFLNFDIVK